MGVVYKARHKQLGRLVALKMIRSADHASPNEVARFLTEAKARARLDHPHIVPVYEVGEDNGLPYFVMALVEGGSLQARIARGPLPATEAARLVRQAADAIEHAHLRGVIHRDVKPHNILLETVDEINGRRVTQRAERPAGPCPDFAFQSAKVSDFGLARMAGQDGLTASGEILGTPSYMAPEQTTGKPEGVGTSSDIYSLGAVLYCLLTGRPPFQAASAIETLQLVRDEEPVTPRRLNPSVPRDLEAVCLKCLEKEPARRYSRAVLLAEDLQRFLDGKPTVAQPVGRIGRTWRWARRQPAAAATALALTAATLALVAGVAAYAWELRLHNEELSAARSRERQQREEAEARGRLLQRRSYADGIRRAAASWENVRRQIEDQDAGRPIPDVGAELPAIEDCLLPASDDGRSAEDLRGFEWYFLQRRGSGIRAWRGLRIEPESIGFSRDGRLAVSVATTDTAAHIWDVDSGREIFRQRGNGGVSAAALAPNGLLLAVGDGAGSSGGGETATEELPVWDWKSGKKVAALTLGARRICLTAFSPDGTMLAAVGELPDKSGVVAVWDIGSWKQRCHWRRARPGSALCFSADGRYLAEALPDASGPGAIRVHDLRTSQERRIVVDALADGITRLAFAPDGATIASGDGRGKVVLWDVANGLPRRDWRIADKLISGVSFSADGKTLAVSAKTAAGVKPGRAFVQLWEAATGSPRSIAWGPGSLIHNIAYAPDGAVALACGDAIVRLWNPGRLEECLSLPAGHKETWTVAFSPDGQTLATGGDDNKVKLWNVATGDLRSTLNGHFTLVSAVAFCPEGNLLASVGYDGRIRMWDAASGASSGPAMKCSETAVRCVAFAPDGRTLATAGRDRCIRLWNLRTGSGGQPELSERVKLSGHTADVLSLAYSPDGQLLASGSDDRTVRLWDATSGTSLRSIEENASVRCVAFSPDGRLACGTDEGEVKMADAAGDGPATVLVGHAGRVRCLAFTRDGRTLASGGDDQVVRLWQATTGQPLLTLRGHDKPIYALAFAPNGRYLATGCFDGSARVWLAQSDLP
jgi:WD40 repeat protein